MEVSAIAIARIPSRNYRLALSILAGSNSLINVTSQGGSHRGFSRPLISLCSSLRCQRGVNFILFGNSLYDCCKLCAKYKPEIDQSWRRSQIITI